MCRKLLEIFYELLNPGGEIGLYFIGTAPVFSTYDTMQTDAKWSSYLHVRFTHLFVFSFTIIIQGHSWHIVWVEQDTENYIPRTFYSPDPAGDMKQLLELLNFQVQQCSVVDRNFHFHSPKEMIGMSWNLIRYFRSSEACWIMVKLIQTPQWLLIPSYNEYHRMSKVHTGRISKPQWWRTLTLLQRQIGPTDLMSLIRCFSFVPKNKKKLTTH